MTYTALCTLLALGDDLSRVNRKGIVTALKHLQKPDGSFASTASGTENDMRFVYCACAISTLLNDWSGVDIDRAVNYIVNSTAFDHAFGQGPYQEAHGGSTYCAIASLALMGKLDAIGFQVWCIHLQIYTLFLLMFTSTHTHTRAGPHQERCSGSPSRSFIQLCG